MDEFLIKLRLLDSIKRQEILNFLDFLLNKQKKEREGNFKFYKEQILEVSTWNEEDVAEIKASGKKLDQWQVPEW
ncbi:MAG: hypothetical protein KIPDCIKN_00737 [Haliscomenobacter sp.]|jgi:hypothetical protein|nr:hypothetical protein [Haliscomenobacter sp.]